MLGFDIKISKDTTTKLRTDFEIEKKIRTRAHYDMKKILLEYYWRFFFAFCLPFFDSNFIIIMTVLKQFFDDIIQQKYDV